MPAPYRHPREHLDDLVAYVVQLLEHARRPAPVNDAEARTRAEHQLELARREDEIAARCESTALMGERLPLDRVRMTFGLSPTEARVLAVLAVLELSPEARKAAEGLLADASATATVGLVEALVYRHTHARGASAEELIDDGRLFVHSLAELGSSELPWLARPVRAARRVLELALGRVRLEHEVARVATLVDEPPAGEDLLLDPDRRAAVLAAVRRQIVDPTAPVPVLAGPRGSGRASLALAAARASDRTVISVRADALPRTPPELVRMLGAIKREALLFGAVLLVRELEVLAGDAERSVADLIPLAGSLLASHIGPVVITASRNIWPPLQRRAPLVIELGVPTEAERIELWRRAIGDPALAVDAASRYRITGGTIERAGETARNLATDRPVALADIQIGVRNQLDADLATLGRRVDWQQTWDDLVLPDDVRDELVELVARVRHRRHVLDNWGFARKVAKGTGIAALFSGPPGTGKTMVAGLLARELQLDLYLIDVSRMVSKWIGETEKNLARLFDAAAAGHVILLFDEADSLFAKRTSVQSSNDRYANLESNFLLQRMESFDGITILTTNLESSVDDAFKRRLAFRIKFPVPELAERALLWRAMLPAEADVAQGIDFRSLAERFEMSGGYIRNAVLRAAYLAAADESAITMEHLQRAAMLEYTAMGKIIQSDL